VPGSAGETGQAPRRGLRDRPLGRVAILAAILLAAVIVARSCGETAADVPKEEAVEIAKREVDFEPTDYQIRLIKQGVQSREIWLVGLERRGTDDRLLNATSVLVDANTGEVVDVEVTVAR
jgi:hypothetical protein